VRSYSRTREAAGLLFVAGILGRDGDDLVDGGPAAEVAQSLVNLEAAIAPHGVDRTAVARLVVYTTDLSAAAAIDAVFAEFFPEPRPVRTMLEVAALPAAATVEVEATCELGAR
jgi:2-iminobutanoate/2-iminopropanoate deaminase